jgi:hypothetical protein
MRYPGGKGGAGVYQRLINLIPAHTVYIETHLGGGNLLERKKPAPESIGIDLDGRAIASWRSAHPGRDDVRLLNASAHDFLEEYRFNGSEFVYADPPYVMETRTSGPLYRFEYTDADHIELLTLLRALPCPVMLSGYWSQLYADLLVGWRHITYTGMTRGGPREESLWLNYEPPAVPADTAFVGADWRARDKLRKRKNRWRARLEKMPADERAAMLELLVEMHEATEPGQVALLPVQDSLPVVREPQQSLFNTGEAAASPQMAMEAMP